MASASGRIWASVPGVGGGYTNAIAFAILVLVLALRPQGLMGRLH